MADRVDYYFRQRVTEAELDLGFSLLEKADRDLAADLGIHGIISGAIPAPHSPVPDLTVDLTAPARAYDNLGQRVFFGTGQRIDCGVDLVGLPTDVATAGNERWVGIFLRFKRQLSDPRTDGNSQQVFFRRDESFEIVVRQAPESPAGTAPKPALEPDELLVCDVLRRPGQTQIVASDIDLSRRQAFIFAQASAVAAESGLWSVLEPASATVQASLDEVDAELRDHFSGTARRHAASAIDYTPRGFLSATTAQGAIDEVVDHLSSAASDPGASLVGAGSVVGTPHALSAGSVASQLAALLGYLNAHIGKITGAHSAAAISVVDSGSKLDATNVEAALAEILTAFESEHFRANETNSGQHRVIRQPVLGANRTLLWESAGVGSQHAKLRVYADHDYVCFTMNAAWDGSLWQRDFNAAHSGGFRFSRERFELLHQTAGSAFADFGHKWQLTMSALSNSNTSFEMTGNAREVGRAALWLTNHRSSSEFVTNVAAVTFRSRLSAAPSSITLTKLDGDAAWVDPPMALFADRDGFVVLGTEQVSAGGALAWYGSYTAIA